MPEHWNKENRVKQSANIDLKCTTKYGYIGVQWTFYIKVQTHWESVKVEGVNVKIDMNGRGVWVI